MHDGMASAHSNDAEAVSQKIATDLGVPRHAVSTERLSMAEV